MSEHIKHDDFSPPASAENDVLALIKKMQQQLSVLEGKIDTLIMQSAPRTFEKRPFSKPFRSFDRPPRRFDRERGSSSGERSFSSGRRFEKHHDEETRDSGAPHKPYGNPQESGSGNEQHFKKRYGGSKRGFDPKSKPFYLKRKDRG